MFLADLANPNVDWVWSFSAGVTEKNKRLVYFRELARKYLINFSICNLFPWNQICINKYYVYIPVHIIAVLVLPPRLDFRIFVSLDSLNGGMPADSPSLKVLITLPRVIKLLLIFIPKIIRKYKFMSNFDYTTI